MTLLLPTETLYGMMLILHSPEPEENGRPHRLLTNIEVRPAHALFEVWRSLSYEAVEPRGKEQARRWQERLSPQKLLPIKEALKRALEMEIYFLEGEFDILDIHPTLQENGILAVAQKWGVEVALPHNCPNRPSIQATAQKQDLSIRMAKSRLRLAHSNP